MYVKVKDGVVEAFPYGGGELMRDNPNTSFPATMSDEVLARYGIYPVAPREVPRPFDPVAQNASVIDPVLEGGVWVQAWAITAASDEEVMQRTADLAQSVRAQRDSLLSQSDWTALSDTAPMASKWIAYRAELRGVTSQPGFPLSVVWPTEPE
jgi:hypothetical protein